jgi:hypothetical protein
MAVAGAGTAYAVVVVQGGGIQVAYVPGAEVDGKKGFFERAGRLLGIQWKSRKKHQQYKQQLFQNPMLFVH